MIPPGIILWSGMVPDVYRATITPESHFNIDMVLPNISGRSSESGNTSVYLGAMIEIRDSGDFVALLRHIWISVVICLLGVLIISGYLSTHG